MFLSELDGANFTVSATGSGSIDILNHAGTLNNAGASSTSNGSINLSSADAVTLSADLNGGSGTISIAANTDGTGSEGFDQLGASLVTTNTNANAVAITVNTSSGGTGDALIGNGVIGSNSGGAMTVNSNAGNIRGATTLRIRLSAIQTGVSIAQQHETSKLRLQLTTRQRRLGRDQLRPLQIDNFGTDEAATCRTRC